MKAATVEKLLFVTFILSVAFLSFTYGLAAGIWNLPPAQKVRVLDEDLRDLAEYWKNDLKIEPTRHLVPDDRPDRQRFTVFSPENMGDGLLLISGLTPERGALHSAVLYDTAGREIHSWPIHYDEIDPEGPRPQNVFPHGLAIFEDGTLVVNFDNGNALAKVDSCGRVLWSITGDFHHAVTRAADGTIWTWRTDSLVQLDPATGREMQEINLIEDVLRLHELQGILGILSDEDESEFRPMIDPFHGNHVEPLPPDLADAFPAFEAGDLLISLRSLNLVAVIDSETFNFKWWQIGPWHRQHHPRFLRDGSILVYNNNMGFGVSQIMKVDPQRGHTEVVFEGNDAIPFYSWRRGKHEMLENGNLLITESERGRVFMVTSAGQIVWEYNNLYDEKRNGVISNAMYLPFDFFESGALRCAPSVSETQEPLRMAKARYLDIRNAPRLTAFPK